MLETDTLLSFYAESGIDFLVGEEVVDYYALNQAPVTPLTPSVVLPFNAPKAVEVTLEMNSIEELRQTLVNFEGVLFKKTAKNFVFAEGYPNANIMIIGTIPEPEDDATGLPFQGRHGELLGKMLASIGLSRESAYLTNLSPWRTPGNRALSVVETNALMPFLHKHIELAAPKIIIAFGGVASLLIKSNENILKLRGNSFDYKNISLIPMIAPSDLLRTPLQKKLAMRDLLTLKSKLVDKCG